MKVILSNLDYQGADKYSSNDNVFARAIMRTIRPRLISNSCNKPGDNFARCNPELKFYYDPTGIYVSDRRSHKAVRICSATNLYVFHIPPKRKLKNLCRIYGIY